MSAQHSTLATDRDSIIHNTQLFEKEIPLSVQFICTIFQCRNCEHETKILSSNICLHVLGDGDREPVGSLSSYQICTMLICYAIVKSKMYILLHFCAHILMKSNRRLFFVISKKCCCSIWHWTVYGFSQ